MIDVHCHLNFHKFQDDYDEVIKRASEKGVTIIINVGTQVSSSLEAVKLADTYEDLYAIVGVHPHHADKLESNWISELEKLCGNKKVLGIGEVGMDYFNYQSNGIVDPKLQKDAFETQIEMAYRKKLPLQIHNRHAGHDILGILKHHKNLLQNVPGMFHCMSGDVEFLKEVLDLGFYVGFDGNITYKGIAPGETAKLNDLVLYAPIERIVVETDSPYLTPIPFRGKRNEPAYAIIVGQYIAQLKKLPYKKIVEKTTENVYTIFTRLN